MRTKNNGDASSLGVRKEQIYDSFTGQIQMVYRHSSLAENWSLSDRIVSNENDSPQALEWQRGHGKIVIFEIPFFLNFIFTSIVLLRTS